MQRGEKLSGRSVSNGSHCRFVRPLLVVVGAGLFAALIGLSMKSHFDLHIDTAAWASNAIEAKTVWKATGEVAQERRPDRDIFLQAYLWQIDEAALQHVLERALSEEEGAMEKSP